MYSDIIAKGTDIAYSWLRTHGYFQMNLIQVSQNEYIVADGKSRRILVKVNAVQYPGRPRQLTDAELLDIVVNASVLDREPWVAECQVYENGELHGDIRWRNLSR